jgi:hypothetical protein
MISTQKFDAGSIKKLAIFLHIQKTAGTSIIDVARRHYGNEGLTSHGDHLEGFNQFPLRDKFFETDRILRKYDATPFISGHFGYDFAKPFLSTRYSFTFLRNPIERVLSFYYFCRSRDPKEFDIYALTQQVSLDEFLLMGLKVPAVKACIWNNQAWQLAHGYGNSDRRNILCFGPSEILDLAIRHLEDFSYIGFTETFENDRDKIFAALGIAPSREKIFSNANPARPTLKDLSQSTSNILEELTYLDQALYKEAWSRRDSFLKRLIKKNLKL